MDGSRIMVVGVTLAAVLAPSEFAPGAYAGLPVTGVPVSDLAPVDAEMQDFMSTYNLDAGVLAIMKDGRVIYQRGFGYDYFNNPLPEHAPMRLASISKAICANAIYALAAQGLINMNDHAFNLGQAGGGILTVTPCCGPGDPLMRMQDITVQHLLDHRAGFGPDCPWGGDCAFGSIQIATAMGIPSPAGPDNTINYVLGQPLLYTPDTDMLYTNIAYLPLSLIIEERSGQSFITYVRQHVLTPDMWVPATDILAARTFRAYQSPREPLYHGSGTTTNVYPPYQQVPECYGGIDYEQADGYAGLVSSAATLLTFNQTYGWNFNGSLPGTSTTVSGFPNSDVRIVVLLNDRRTEPPGEHLASIGRDRIWAVLQALDAIPGFVWPTMAVDGFWVDFLFSGATNYGAFDNPFSTMNGALGYVADGTKLRFKPGTTNWAGTIDKKLRLDAPFGMARIGG